MGLTIFVNIFLQMLLGLLTEENIQITTFLSMHAILVQFYTNS